MQPNSMHGLYSSGTYETRTEKMASFMVESNGNRVT